MTIGQNTVSGEMLRGFVERIERIREEKQKLTDDEGSVFAEVKAAGFTPRYVRALIKRRAAKPSDVQEDEAMMDLYLHALGMANETPLFRHVGMMNVDTTARDAVIAALKQLVPAKGEIIVKAGGSPVRLWRDKDGAVHAEDYKEPKPPAAGPAEAPAARAPRREVPDCTEDEAEALGHEAAKNDEPVIANPFPWDDKRRPRWDKGWRDFNGGDGMGPKP